MKFIRNHWQDFGLLLALIVTICVWKELQAIGEIRAALWLSFAAILIHQFEEYRWPGAFGGLFNIVIFKSAHPANYPLNPQSAMIINLVIAYVFYLIPVFFPNIIWLGLAPVLMGFFQIVWHGVFANLKAKTFYNPGLFAALFLHLPIGIWYIAAVTSHNMVTVRDWVIGIIYFIVAVYLFIVQGNMWLKNPQSPYTFTSKQLGRFKL